MTLEQRVARVLALLNLSDRAARKRIEMAITSFDEHRQRERQYLLALGHRVKDWYRPANNSEKGAAKRLVRALNLVEDLLEGKAIAPKLYKIVRHAFSNDDFYHWLRGLAQLRMSAEGFSEWKLGQPKPNAWEKRAAAEAAADLLKQFKLPLRGKQFHGIATIFYGNERANLHWHCDCVRRQSAGN
jgi:hypothetical protein